MALLRDITGVGNIGFAGVPTVILGTGVSAAGGLDSTIIGANTAAAGSFTTLDTTGNVGVGTTAPHESITTRGNIFIETNSTSADSGDGLFWQSTTNGWLTSGAHAAIYGKRTDAANGYLRFDTRQSGTTQEAMRIDSGNLLVGTTSNSVYNDVSGTGIALNAGQIQIAGTGIPLYANRQGSDGGLIEFRKDGASVGSIGVDNSNNIYIASSSASHCGLQLGSNTILPADNAGASIDATVDLASSGFRFKDLYLSGNATIGGALSKGSGSFKIDHPLPEKTETHHLVHSFVEAPQADLYYRGKVALVNGTATVNIDEAAEMTDGTFEALCGDVQCFTSNESDWCPTRGSVTGNLLTIEAQDSNCSDTISWLVIGERKDQHMLDTNWTDENGHVIVEPEKVVEALEA